MNYHNENVLSQGRVESNVVKIHGGKQHHHLRSVDMYIALLYSSSSELSEGNTFSLIVLPPRLVSLLRKFSCVTLLKLGYVTNSRESARDCIGEGLIVSRSRRMSQQQESLTDRLVSVISSIQREGGSGVLMVKRGEGIFLEEGTLVFVNGQITEARTGRLHDARARNLLSTWENCRFLFVSSSSEAGVNGSPSTLPAGGRATGPLAIGSPAHMTDTRRPDPQTPMPSSLKGRGGPQEAGEGEEFGEKGRGETPAERAPYLIQHLDVAQRLIEQQGLSRAHRQLLFLIDGRRSIVDLARLTGKKGRELYRLLEDLERAYVIRKT
jgi:hypothetical protein